ncbi:hypothetical protein EJB05_02806, partial [Eragrostis curvula]
LEGLNAILTDKLVPLSTQQLVDCSREDDGNEGCRGGGAAGAFDYVRKRGGLAAAADYPYTGRQAAACQLGCKPAVPLLLDGYAIVRPAMDVAALRRGLSWWRWTAARRRSSDTAGESSSGRAGPTSATRRWSSATARTTGLFVSTKIKSYKALHSVL